MLEFPNGSDALSRPMRELRPPMRIIALASNSFVVSTNSFRLARDFSIGLVRLHTRAASCSHLLVHDAVAIAARSIRSLSFCAKVAVKNTPLITQYLGVKQRVPDAVLF